MYASWFLDAVEKWFDSSKQIPEDMLEKKLSLKKLTYWSDSEKEIVYQYMEENRIFTFERQMRPWLLTPLISYSQAVEKLYSLLI